MANSGGYITSTSSATPEHDTPANVAGCTDMQLADQIAHDEPPDTVVVQLEAPRRPKAPEPPQLDRCCYPIGEPRTPGFRYCAAPIAHPGAVYCLEHKRVCYVSRDAA